MLPVAFIAFSCEPLMVSNLQLSIVQPKTRRLPTSISLSLHPTNYDDLNKYTFTYTLFLPVYDMKHKAYNIHPSDFSLQSSIFSL